MKRDGKTIADHPRILSWLRLYFERLSNCVVTPIPTCTSAIVNGKRTAVTRIPFASLSTTAGIEAHGLQQLIHKVLPDTKEYLRSKLDITVINRFKDLLNSFVMEYIDAFLVFHDHYENDLYHHLNNKPDKVEFIVDMYSEIYWLKFICHFNLKDNESAKELLKSFKSLRKNGWAMPPGPD